MQTPASDALTDRLALTVLAAPVRAALATTNGTEKVLGTVGPSSLAAILQPVLVSTGKTLDLKIQGRRLSTDAWTDLVTFTQVAAAGVTPQRANVPSYPRYRVVEVVGGTAFSGTDQVIYTCTLVGTDVRYAPIVQV